MVFGALLLEAGRIWPKTKICWLSANVFHTLPHQFGLCHLILLQIWGFSAYLCCFSTGEANQTKTKHRKPPYFAYLYRILSWPQVSLQLHSICFPFLAKFIERIVYMNCLYYHIFPFYSLLNPLQQGFYPFHSITSALAKSNTHVFILILLNFPAET